MTSSWKFGALSLGALMLAACGSSGSGSPGGADAYGDASPRFGSGPGDADGPGDARGSDAASSGPTVVIEPAEPTTTDALVAEVSLEEGGTPGQVAWRWTRNGDPLQEASGPALQPELTARGDLIRATAELGDGRTAWAEVTIGNAPPELSEVWIEPAEPVAGDELTCEAAGAEDPDGDDVSVAYAWRVDGEAVDGADTATFDTSGLTSGQTVSCEATPEDDADAGEPVASDPVELGNSSPIVQGATIEPDAGTQKTTFTCTAVGLSDPDGDEVSASIDWTRNGEIIPGAGGESFTAEGLARGDVLRCMVTPVDPSTTGEPVTSDGATIENTPPTVGTVLVMGPDAEALTCEAKEVEDLDGDEVTLSYAWYVGEEVVEGANGETFDASGFGAGTSVTCAVTPNDGFDDGPTTWSKNAWSADNHPPTAPGVTIVPDTPKANQSLDCTVAEAAEDPDGDELTYSYTWYRGDAEGEADHQGPTLPADETSEGEHWTCEVVASDGDATGPPGSASASIGPACDDMQADGVRLWPQEADVGSCTNTNGTDKPGTGEGAATWFKWNGCGTWKEFPVPAGEPVLIRGTTDNAQLVNIHYDVREKIDGSWQTTTTVGPIEKEDHEDLVTYTPQTDAVRIVAQGGHGFYVSLFSCTAP